VNEKHDHHGEPVVELGKDDGKRRKFVIHDGYPPRCFSAGSHNRQRSWLGDSFARLPRRLASCAANKATARGAPRVNILPDL
jgi:hypothetical protein